MNRCLHHSAPSGHTIAVTFLEAVPEIVNQATSISPGYECSVPPIVQHLGCKGKTGADGFLFRFGHFSFVSLAT
jgi:hypothetical protein